MTREEIEKRYKLLENGLGIIEQKIREGEQAIANMHNLRATQIGQMQECKHWLDTFDAAAEKPVTIPENEYPRLNSSDDEKDGLT